MDLFKRLFPVNAVNKLHCTQPLSSAAVTHVLGCVTVTLVSYRGDKSEITEWKIFEKVYDYSCECECNSTLDF